MVERFITSLLPACMIYPNEDYETIIKIISPDIDQFIIDWYKSKKGTFKRGDDIEGQLRLFERDWVVWIFYHRI